MLRSPQLQIQKMALLSNVHSGLSDPTTSPQKKVHITNSYVYYHYKCDGYNDVVSYYYGVEAKNF